MLRTGLRIPFTAHSLLLPLGLVSHLERTFFGDLLGINLHIDLRKQSEMMFPLGDYIKKIVLRRWLEGWMGEWQSHFKDCLLQSKLRINKFCNSTWATSAELCSLPTQLLYFILVASDGLYCSCNFVKSSRAVASKFK